MGCESDSLDRLFYEEVLEETTDADSGPSSSSERHPTTRVRRSGTSTLQSMEFMKRPGVHQCADNRLDDWGRR